MQRLNEIFSCKVNNLLLKANKTKNIFFKYYIQLFDTVSQFYPEFRSKLEAIEGDLMEPSMGISEEDEKKLIDNVNIVFHSAATVRFDEPLK